MQVQHSGYSSRAEEISTAGTPKMDARRRTIALSQDGPLGNGGYGQTGIPIPGSTMKKPALRAPAARMSMAPAARVVSGGSSSLAPGLGSSQDGGAGTRRSTMAPPPGARGGMGGLGMGVTPQSNRMMGGGGRYVYSIYAKSAIWSSGEGIRGRLIRECTPPISLPLCRPTLCSARLAKATRSPAHPQRRVPTKLPRVHRDFLPDAPVSGRHD